MVYIGKELTRDYRSKILDYIQRPWGGQYGSTGSQNKGAFRINFYSGTMPDMSSISYTMDSPPSMVVGSYNASNDNYTTNTPVVSSSIAQNPENQLLAYINPSFFNWSMDGDQLISTQQPQNLNYVADGTIGFFELLFYGDPDTLTVVPGYTNRFYYGDYNNNATNIASVPEYEPRMNNNWEIIDPETDEKISSLDTDAYYRVGANDSRYWKFGDADYSKVHKFSAIYGSVGILSTGAELIVDRIDISSTSIPKMYEFGINPQLDVPPEPVV